MGVAQKRSSPTANPGGKKRRKSVDYTARMAEEEALMMSMQSMVATLSSAPSSPIIIKQTPTSAHLSLTKPAYNPSLFPPAPLPSSSSSSSGCSSSPPPPTVSLSSSPLSFGSLRTYNGHSCHSQLTSSSPALFSFESFMSSRGASPAPSMPLLRSELPPLPPKRTKTPSPLIPEDIVEFERLSNSPFKGDVEFDDEELWRFSEEGSSLMNLGEAKGDKKIASKK
mmetsp:Transcript_26295/g.49746  ORF Transcript_26295/g.49746 Transcript_26295/m.49746 type:complete len:225 (-) Transcript_26295:185-859(-)|eukprot:CAMPEP_0182494260 /NCGR_PEP_ID=MMETSP1321-20130603/3143_1 /TAXON_ID=91990 /ORGANISM="Bolidomonas sp., Strain RCC1657" /LENGTH=224 /DNA_ID=CAMNT_0024697291 /DNA_START=344 /DNA_END=1018 /DNA_ORIENTATION=-